MGKRYLVFDNYHHRNESVTAEQLVHAATEIVDPGTVKLFALLIERGGCYLDVAALSNRYSPPR